MKVRRRHLFLLGQLLVIVLFQLYNIVLTTRTISSDRPPPSYNNNNDGASHVSILKAPYQIIQIGSPRTGSTFQFQLLCSIIQLKNPDAICDFLDKKKLQTEGGAMKRILKGMKNKESFLYKAHEGTRGIRNLSQDGRIGVFSSGGVGSDVALYVQKREQIEKCPSCEIKEYQPFFGLTDTEVSQLQNHMRLFTIIRQCCGLQMSKYEVLRLNGCDMSSHLDKPDYPNCEKYDLVEIEIKFAASPVPYTVNNPEYNWAKPGDCKRFSDRITREKVGFNGRPVTTCELKTISGGKH